MRRNRAGPNSKISEFWNSNSKNFEKNKKNLKNTLKLDEILRSLVKKFLQISDILLVKIQNESNMIKWAHLAHGTHGGYFLPPMSAEQKSHEWAHPLLEQATEGGGVVQKSPALEQNSTE
jgi:hypothetical protein